MVMTGRLHKGDENGDTQYAYASLVLRSKIAYYGHSNTAPSLEIEESGKDKKRRFVFTCPENNVIIGQMHEGDENGHTYYKHAKFYLNNNLITTENHKWSDWVQESGKKSKGLSEFICPLNTVITGREHSGDENGETRYRYSEIFIDGVPCATYNNHWSAEKKESSGEWALAKTCEVMTGRRHEGDENGQSKYQFSSIGVSPTVTDSVKVNKAEHYV